MFTKLVAVWAIRSINLFIIIYVSIVPWLNPYEFLKDKILERNVRVCLSVNAMIQSMVMITDTFHREREREKKKEGKVV